MPHTGPHVVSVQAGTANARPQEERVPSREDVAKAEEAGETADMSGAIMTCKSMHGYERHDTLGFGCT